MYVDLYERAPYMTTGQLFFPNVNSIELCATIRKLLSVKCQCGFGEHFRKDLFLKCANLGHRFFSVKASK